MKEWRKIVKELKRQGAEVTITQSNHYKVKCPDGTICILTFQNGPTRSIRNNLAMLRRHGFTL